MGHQEVEFIQALCFIGLGVFMSVMLYGYIYHLYSQQKNGTRDYEKYSELVLDDDIDSKILENRKGDTK